MILVQNLSKRYGGQVIFDNVTFTLGSKERVGLVGRNGHGKTTLLNILARQEPYDEGTIVWAKNYRVGYLSQQLDLSQPTVLEEACRGLPDDQKSEQWKVKKILSGLGFAEEDFPRDPAEFSGGYRMRMSLAKVLVSEPNLLLLDEPTNFLDVVSIRWLIRFLNAWRNEMILVSHDRSFMDSVATHTMGIHRAKVRKLPGSTLAYYSQIAKEEEVYERQRLNEEKKREQMEQFISRFRAKARQANLAQSRIKTLEKQERREKLQEIETLSFSFNEAPCPARYVLEACELVFSYSGASPHLIDDFTLAVENRDRICIVGKNGQGKTTLLRLLAGELAPLEGRIGSHPDVQKAYFGQSGIAKLHQELTVEEEILAVHPSVNRKMARDICGAMMFSGDYALKKIDVLSGGEKSRVVLGKLLATPANLLLLDEPTHHLDIESCEAMMDAIDSFRGAVILVTHNEQFLRRIARKLVVFHRDELFVFRGGYAEFLEKIGWEDPEELAADERSGRSKDEAEKTPTKKDLRKARADLIARRARTLGPYKRQIEELETAIESMEQQLCDETQALLGASYAQDAAAIARLSKSLPQLRARIETLYEQLGGATEKYEQEESAFEEEA